MKKKKNTPLLSGSTTATSATTAGWSEISKAMQTMTYDRRIRQAIDGIRRIVSRSEDIKPGERRAILNKCDRISCYHRKFTRQVIG